MTLMFLTKRHASQYSRLAACIYMQMPCRSYSRGVCLSHWVIYAISLVCPCVYHDVTLL